MSFYTSSPSLVSTVNHHMKFSVLYYINGLKSGDLLTYLELSLTHFPFPPWSRLDLAYILVFLILYSHGPGVSLSYVKLFPVLSLWDSFNPKFSAMAPLYLSALSLNDTSSEIFSGHLLQSSSELHSCLYPFAWLYFLHSPHHCMELSSSFVCLFVLPLILFVLFFFFFY